MSEKKLKVLEAPKAKPFTGLTIKNNSVNFTPDALLNRLGVSEENRPVWKLKPMTVEQRHLFDAEKNRVSSVVSLWAAENNVDISKINEPLKDDDQEKARKIAQYVAWTQKLSEVEDKSITREIVRTCITGIKMGKAVKGLKYEKDEDGFFCKTLFEEYPNELTDALFKEINRISNLSFEDTLSLSS